MKNRFIQIVVLLLALATIASAQATVNISLNLTAEQVQAGQYLWNNDPDKALYANALAYARAKYLDQKLEEGLNRMVADAQAQASSKLTPADLLSLSQAQKDQICAMVSKPAGCF